jgi:hypothetical protein
MLIGLCNTYNLLKGIIMQNIAIILTIIFAIIVYVVILAITKIFSKNELYMLPFYSKFKKNKA